MSKIKYAPFKYRGQKFAFTENELDFVLGFRIKKYGVVVISISKFLSPRKRSLEVHRLITKRGLRNMKFRKVKNMELSM